MASEGCRSRFRRDWSDLPGDILDTVYRRCCFSPYDRIRFAAVCSSWRAVASWHPKLPFLPLLLPSTGNARRDRKARAYSFEDGRALRAPLPGFPWGKRLVGSHDGGWIAAATGTRIMVVNVFSGAQMSLSTKQSVIDCKCPSKPLVIDKPRSKASTKDVYIRKIIFSEEPSSSHCVLAAITTRCKIALCRVSCPMGGWTTGGCGTDAYEELADIAFCNEKLYSLAYCELFQFDIGVNGSGAPVVTSVQCMHIQRSISIAWGSKSDDKYYVFELRGKPTIALKFSPKSYCCQTNFFMVFELMDDGCTWVEMTSLGDYALFLGPVCCKAVHVSASGWRSEVERNHIYYSEQRLCPRHQVECLERLDLGSYTVYYEKIKRHLSQRIKSRGYHYGHVDSSSGCIWLLPPDL